MDEKGDARITDLGLKNHTGSVIQTRPPEFLDMAPDYD